MLGTKGWIRTLVCSLVILTMLAVSAQAAAPSGLQWQRTGLMARYSGIQMVNNQFILLGSIGDVASKEGPTYLIKVSSDFEHWTTYSLGNKTYFKDILYVQGMYWSLGNSNRIYQSKDLKSWKYMGQSPGRGVADRLFYVNGRFFVVGMSCYASTDGAKWTSVNYTLPVEVPEIGSILYTPNGFLVVGRDIDTEAGFVMKSKDGLKWSGGKNSSLYQPKNLIWDGSQYLVQSNSRLLASADGTSWSPSDYTGNKNVSLVKYTGERLIVADNDIIKITRDKGNTWEQESKGSSPVPIDLVWDGTQFRGINTLGMLLTSGDGLHWAASAPSMQDTVNQLKVINNQFFAVGKNRFLAQSSDGVNWIYKNVRIAGIDNSSKLDIISIASDGQKYILLTRNSRSAYECYYSDDLENWTASPSNKNTLALADLNDLAFDGKGYVMVGSNTYVSADGINWTFTRTNLHGLNSVIYQGGKYITIGASGLTATSTDGLSWTAANVDKTSWLKNLTYDGKQYIMNDLDGNVWTSSDATSWRLDMSWTPENTIKYNKLRLLAYNGQRYVALTDNTGTQRWYAGTLSGEKIPSTMDSFIQTTFTGLPK